MAELNLRQKITVSAIKAALELTDTPTEHARQTVALENFNKQGFDPMDWPTWIAQYSATQNSIVSLAGQKSISELQPKKT